MDHEALNHGNIFKYTNKIPKPKELVTGYQKLIDINLEPIKNYKSHLDELIEDTKKLEIEYKELQPSHFSAIIEITSPGKVVGRLIGTSETGNMLSPYVGTIDDNKISQDLLSTRVNTIEGRVGDTYPLGNGETTIPGGINKNTIDIISNQTDITTNQNNKFVYSALNEITYQVTFSDKSTDHPYYGIGHTKGFLINGKEPRGRDIKSWSNIIDGLMNNPNYYIEIEQKLPTVFIQEKPKYPALLNIQDLELRNEVASDSPLGFFGAYWYAVDLSSSIGVKNFPALKSLQIGYKIKLNLSKLYTESMYGVTLDVGLRGKINENINFGVVIKNVGKEFDKNLTSNTPRTVGVGFVYQIPNAYLKLLSDIVRQEEIILTKFSIQTNFKYANLIAGTTRGDNYEDIAFGLHIHIQDWSFIYGNLNHSNTILGNPVSIELRKYF